jgi:phosphatidylinositol alpha-1,6-mannosyltransferase
MERLNWNVYNELRAQFLCSVVGPWNCEASLGEEDKGFGCPVTPVSAFLITAFGRSIACAMNKEYSLCIAGSGVTAPIADAVRGLFNIPTITFIHGLDLVVNNRIYQQLFIPAIRRSDLVIANSHNTANLAITKGVSKYKIKVLFPGVKIPNLSSTNDNFRQQHKLEGKRILISVGRLVRRKGLVEFLKYSFPEILRECPDTVYIIVGSEPENSLKRDRGVLQELKTIIQERKLFDRVVLLGRVDEEILAQAYLAADLLVFPVRETPGDTEGFGMVAIEAAAYGLPTIGFAVGGLPDAVRHGYSGLLVKKEEYNELSAATIDYLGGNNDAITPHKCIEHAAEFSWENYGKKLRGICNRLGSGEKVHPHNISQF